MRIHPRVMWLVAVLTVALVGCGSDLKPAGGTVTVDGKPVESGTIMFHPVAGGRPATGTIADGTFTLSYADIEDGLPVGEYKVAIVADKWIPKSTTGPGKSTGDAADDEFGGTAGRLVHIVPPVYNDVLTTPMTHTVTESSDGPQQFACDITTK